MLDKPKVGTWLELYFGDELKYVKIEEWIGNKCFFTDGYYLSWNNLVGFRYD